MLQLTVINESVPASVEIPKNICDTDEYELMVGKVWEKAPHTRERPTGRCQEKNNRIHSQSSVGIERSFLTEKTIQLSYWTRLLYLYFNKMC